MIYHHPDPRSDVRVGTHWTGAGGEPPPAVCMTTTDNYYEKYEGLSVWSSLNATIHKDIAHKTIKVKHGVHFIAWLRCDGYDQVGPTVAP